MPRDLLETLEDLGFDLSNESECPRHETSYTIPSMDTIKAEGLEVDDFGCPKCLSEFRDLPEVKGLTPAKRVEQIKLLGPDGPAWCLTSAQVLRRIGALLGREDKFEPVELLTSTPEELALEAATRVHPDEGEKEARVSRTAKRMAEGMARKMAEALVEDLGEDGAEVIAIIQGGPGGSGGGDDTAVDRVARGYGAPTHFTA